MRTHVSLWQHRSEEQAFTLVELVVTILIIGVVAAIAVPALLGVRGNAYDATTKEDAVNTATLIHSEFLEKMNNEHPDTWVVGYGEGTPSGISTLQVVIGTGETSELVDQPFFLSEGTRGSVGGTAEHFTLCFINPFGKVYRTPETAYVWDSSAQTFRSAKEDDDCVEVLRLMDEYPAPDPEPTPDPEPSPDEDQDWDNVPPIYAEVDPPGTSEDVLFPIQLTSPDPEFVDRVRELTITFDGEVICPSLPVRSGEAHLIIPNGHRIPGGLIEVHFNGTVIGAIDLSSYPYLSLGSAEPAWISQLQNDLAVIRSWLDSTGVDGEYIYIEVGQDISTYASVDFMKINDVEQLDVLTRHGGRTYYTIFPHEDRIYATYQTTLRSHYLTQSLSGDILDELPQCREVLPIS